MKLLANENFPGEAVRVMRQRGHDVLWIRETHAGIPDTSVLAIAVSQGRVLPTFDKDFGELAFKSRLPASVGIILFRIRKQSPEIIARRTADILAGRTDWSGQFSVVEDDRIRMTALPAQP